MKHGAFRGATAWEAYIHRLWITVLYPRYWRTSGARRIIRTGWDTT